MPRAAKNSAEEKETKSKAKATSTVKKSTKAKSTAVSETKKTVTKKAAKSSKATTPKKTKKVVKKAVKMIKPVSSKETKASVVTEKSADVKTTKTVKKVSSKKVSEPKKEIKTTAKVSKTVAPKKAVKTTKVTASKKVTKPVQKVDSDETKKATKSTATTKAAKTTASKKVTKAVKVDEPKTAAKAVEPKVSKKATAKKVTKKSTNSKTAKKTTKKVAKVTSLATKRKSTASSKTKKVQKEVQKDFANILEYYDLPYRYNETVVKILAQTPKVLFVYWDIADSDRENYVKRYGDYFFNDTYPVLIIHNKTLNYYQELEINDFANSWYISISDSHSEYTVELGRRFKEYAQRNEYQPHKEDLNNLIYITTSNNLIVPNDHVLLDKIGPKVKYRNVKTGEEYYKDTKAILLNNKILDFYELYKGIYQVEDLSNFFVLNNPSSGNPTSTFK